MDSTQIVNLENSKTGGDLYQSHKLITSYWSPYWDKMEVYYDNLSGDMWTADEKLLFKRKKKAPVVINDLKPAERTVLGLFIQNKYDVKFAPREQAQDISDVLQRLYAWTAYSQDWAHKDIDTVRQAWCGGVGYQEVYMKIVPGEEPVMITSNVNPFSIAWDPESRDLINREDADFVDRDTWVSFNDLTELFPDQVTSIDGLQTQGTTGYQQAKTYADRSGEWYDSKNNRYKVTERYYKVRKRQWSATNDQGSKPIKDPQNRAQYEQNGYHVHNKSQEFLYLAIICPAWKIDSYLYNGEYHCQPRDLFNDKIIFPFVELVAESINGVPFGFVQHLVQINRLKNSAVSNIFHAQKHAASTALLRKRKLFGGDEATAQSFDKNHSDADRVFQASDQADLGSDVISVPKGLVSQDSSQVLQIADIAFDKVSAASPSLQGQQESSSVSGVLNSQRIEQSTIQLQPFIANVKHFLKRRAELCYYYWREYYTYPMKVRIIGDQGAQAAQSPGPTTEGQPDQPQQTHVEINQERPVMDWQGQPTGAIEKINDINAARYDVDIEDSFQSPTYRAKVLQQLTDVMQRPGMDPGLMDILFLEFAKSTDMAQTTKDSIKKYIADKQAAAQQPPQPPPPEPIRVSMSVKNEDLSNPNMISMLVATKVLTPEEAQAMMQQSTQGPMQGPAQDPQLMQDHQGALAENQSLKQQLESRAQEATLKQQQIELEISRFQHESGLKTQQHELEAAKFQHEVGHKENEQETARQALLLKHTEVGQMPAAPVEDTSITIANIKAQAEIEKAHISAESHIQATRLGHEAAAKASRVEKAKPGHTIDDTGEPIEPDYSKAITKLEDGQQNIESTLAEIIKKMSAPKHITVNRDAQNRITGATATIEGGHT